MNRDRYPTELVMTREISVKQAYWSQKKAFETHWVERLARVVDIQEVWPWTFLKLWRTTPGQSLSLSFEVDAVSAS